jgi:diguanylate cyclase (GGDEF)-like protein/PAS domain S-box-containing protein
MLSKALLILIPYLISAGISIWLGVHAWRRRSIAGAQLFAGIAFSEVVWTLGYVMQLITPSLEGKIFWNNIQFVGAITAPLMYLGFALEYDRSYRPPGRFSWKHLVPLAVIMLLFVWTDELHGLFRGNAVIVHSEPFSKLLFEPVPGFAVYTIYAYSLLILTTLILISRYLNAPQLYRIQIGIVLFGVLVPWVTSVITSLGLISLELHELTPITFGISNLIIAWALFRYHLFEIVPVARDYLIEQMRDAVFVLDSLLRIIDLNPAAKVILGLRDVEVVGRKIDTFLPLNVDWSKIITGSSNNIEIVLDKEERPGYYEVQSSKLAHPWGHSVLYLIVLRDIHERKEIEEKLRLLAITDPLTGIFNRRHVFTLAQQEIERANRKGHDLSIILFDIDNFKQVNDAFGHRVGDRVLENLTRRCQADLRSFDIFGRYGGEEFIVVLPETDSALAWQVAERIRILIESLSIPGASETARVTISAGIASLGGRPNMSLDQLLEQADQALYRAKAAGRNKVYK